ncbi:MFS transporter [Pannonibacter sp. Q-1]
MALSEVRCRRCMNFSHSDDKQLVCDLHLSEACSYATCEDFLACVLGFSSARISASGVHSIIFFELPMTTFSPFTARIVAALSVTQLIGWGATFWLPAVIGPAIASDMEIMLPTVMMGPTIMLVVMAMMAWPLSRAFEHCGARPVMVFGSLLGAAGLLAMSFANALPAYVLSWLILGVAGACMLTTAAQIAATEAAGEKARRALAVLVIAGGLTSTITWPLTAYLQAQLGWRLTLLVYAGLMLFVCAPLHAALLVRKPKEKRKSEAGSDHGHIDRTRFALLSASFAANGFFTWGFALTIIVLFEARGLDSANALTAAAFIGIAQWAGRMADLAGGQRWSGLAVGLLGFALFPLSFVILLLVNGFIGAMMFAALYGLASGITAVTRATIPLQIFPVSAYARASSLLATPLNVSFAAAPPIFAAIMTKAGSAAALWIAFAISVFAFGTFFALAMVERERSKPQEDDSFRAT